MNSTVAYFTFKLSIPLGFREFEKKGFQKSWPGYLVECYDVTCTDQVDSRSPVEKLTFVDNNYTKLGNIKAICSDRLSKIFIYLVLDSSFIGLFSVFICLQCRSASRFSSFNVHCDAWRQRMRTSAYAFANSWDFERFVGSFLS